MSHEANVTVHVEIELFARIAGRDYPITTYVPKDGERQLDQTRFAALLREAADAVERAGEEGGEDDGETVRGDGADHRHGAAEPPPGGPPR